MKSRSPGYLVNEHWNTCDRCGFNYREKNMRREWDGAVVCVECVEERHPQDFVRGVKDDTSPKGNVRPAKEATFTTVSYATSATNAPFAQVPSGTFDDQI